MPGGRLGGLISTGFPPHQQEVCLPLEGMVFLCSPAPGFGFYCCHLCCGRVQGAGDM